MKKTTAQKNGLIILLLLSMISAISAQNNMVRSLGKIEGGFGGFGFAYEARVGKQVTIDLSTGLSGRYEIYNNTLEYIIANGESILPAVYISANPRFYYNLNSRVRKGKRTENNSGNYFGARVKLVPHLKLPNPGALVNVHWGLQRSFGKSHKWLFNTHGGMGYAGNIGEGGSKGMIYPSVDAKFAYILF